MCNAKENHQEEPDSFPLHSDDPNKERTFWKKTSPVVKKGGFTAKKDIITWWPLCSKPNTSSVGAVGGRAPTSSIGTVGKDVAASSVGDAGLSPSSLGTS